jgi:hypothetical protein
LLTVFTCQWAKEVRVVIAEEHLICRLINRVSIYADSGFLITRVVSHINC